MNLETQKLAKILIILGHLEHIDIIEHLSNQIDIHIGHKKKPYITAFRAFHAPRLFNIARMS